MKVGDVVCTNPFGFHPPFGRVVEVVCEHVVVVQVAGQLEWHRIEKLLVVGFFDVGSMDRAAGTL